MIEQLIHTMLLLIRAEVCGIALPKTVREGISPEMLPKLYTLSKTHDMAHIVADALGKLGVSFEDEIGKKFKKQYLAALYRYRCSEYELSRITELFEREGIRHVPLKGAVLRNHYGEPWMRTSCDLDVLINEQDLDRATQALVEALEYDNRGRAAYDVQLFSPSGVHVELHYGLKEDSRIPSSAAVLEAIWEHTASRQEGSFLFAMSDEMFYFYHVAHMAKHFETGGCGIRPFLDLWVLERRVEHDRARRDELLEKGGLLTFANVCREVAFSWFEDAEPRETGRAMQDFILRGGVYGSVDNRVAVQRNRRTGKFAYALSKIWLPFDSLKYQYPVIKKHKWLTPLMQIRRWLRIVLRGKVNRSLRELNVNRNMSDVQLEGAADLIKKLGL